MKNPGLAFPGLRPTFSCQSPSRTHALLRNLQSASAVAIDLISIVKVGSSTCHRLWFSLFMRKDLGTDPNQAFKRYSSIVETGLVRCASTTQGMLRSAFHFVFGYGYAYNHYDDRVAFSGLPIKPQPSRVRRLKHSDSSIVAHAWVSSRRACLASSIITVVCILLWFQCLIISITPSTTGMFD